MLLIYNYNKLTPQKTIITSRLLITSLAETDKAFIYELVNTPGWLKFIGDRNVHSHDDALAYIKKILSNPNVIYWVVKLNNNIPNTIGVISFIKRDYLPHHDIGFAMLPQFVNNGYAYEAAKAVLLNIIKYTKHTHILATTIPENTSSIKLLKKLGLAFEKEIEMLAEKLHVYSATTEELKIV